MAIKKLLAVTAAGEAATGFVVVIYPALVVRLLFGVGISKFEISNSASFDKLLRIGSPR